MGGIDDCENYLGEFLELPGKDYAIRFQKMDDTQLGDDPRQFQVNQRDLVYDGASNTRR